MMESDLREAQMKRAMAETAAQKVAMIDHSKFGNVFVATSLLPEEIDLLIVDNNLPAEQQKAVQAAEIKLEIV
jgi:DeoR/GlpR family transcriptional regulator of sugar metabolism